jgi:PAS domain-containing protein
MGTSGHNLVLIMARDFASRLATAVFLVDPLGTLIYYNEGAERILGRAFEEGHPMPAEEWSTTFEPVDELPLGATLRTREPAHRDLTIVGADGVARRIEVTAIPLFAHADEFVGAVAVFWERAEAA